MALHRLLGFTTAVPDPEGLAAFFGELGLGGSPDIGVRRGATAARRSSWTKATSVLVRIEFGCDGPADLDATASTG